MKDSERWDAEWREILQETPLELRSWRVAHKDVDIDNVIDHHVLRSINPGEYRMWFTALKYRNGWHCIRSIERMKPAYSEEGVPLGFFTPKEPFDESVQIISEDVARIFFPTLSDMTYIYEPKKVEA